MGVGDGQNFQNPLQGAIFPGPAVQNIERDVGFDGCKHGRDIAANVNASDTIAKPRKRLAAGLAGAQRYLSLGRPASHQNSDVFVGQAAHCRVSFGTPMRLISHSRSTPELSFTRVRTLSPRFSISAAVARPRLIRKLQCISETAASPSLSPRQPAASISCHAFCLGGFLKVEPP